MTETQDTPAPQQEQRPAPEPVNPPVSDETAEDEDFSFDYSAWTSLFMLWVFVIQFCEKIYNLSVLELPLVIIPAFFVTSFLIYLLLHHSFRRDWDRAASVMVAPFIAGLFFFAINALPLNTENLRFYVNKSTYMNEVEKVEGRAGTPKTKSWDWQIIKDPQKGEIKETLVYDESDKIATPASYSTHLGKGLYQRVTVRPLEDHFYLIQSYLAK